MAPTSHGRPESGSSPGRTHPRVGPRSPFSARLDASFGEPLVDVVLVEADELADLVERNAPFADETANEAFGGTETFGELVDAKHRSAMSWFSVSSG